MTAVLPVRRPGAASALPPVGDPRLLIGEIADRATELLGRIAPWLVRGLVGSMVAAAIVTFLGLAVGPHVFGYRTLTMLTGSMAPQINPGDVAVVTPIAVTDVTEGMVITYHQPIAEHALITHRVVSVERALDGTVTIQTKGDANDAVDPWTATLSGDTAYQVRAVIPELGHLIQALRTPGVTQTLTYGAPALIVGWLLLSIWRPTRDDEEDQR
jgi:signal peptidase